MKTKKKKILDTVQAINNEDIPNEFVDEILERTGDRNLISIEADSAFGKWLKEQGFVFDLPTTTKKKTWGWLAIWW